MRRDLLAISIICSLLLAFSTDQDHCGAEIMPDRQAIALRAKVSADRARVTPGQVVNLNVQISNDGPARALFNPFFLGGALQPAALSATGIDGKRSTNLLGHGISLKAPGQWHWVYLPPGAYLGATVPVSIALSPGTYDLRLVFFRSFIDDRPLNVNAAAQSAALERFQQDFDERELFLSNTVRIEVLRP